MSARDKSCRVSGRRGADYYESAHLVPRSDADWFQINGMGEYNLSQTLLGEWMVDDVRNAIALRRDIHAAFDDRKFVIVPKQSKWVVHFLGQTNSLGDDFHNTHIELKGISPQFLYARFAWTIFPLLSSFLNAHIPRELLVRLPNGRSCKNLYLRGDQGGVYIAEPKRQPQEAPDDHSRGSAGHREAGLSRRACSSHYGHKPTRRFGTMSADTGTSLSSVSSVESPEQPNFDRQQWIRSRRPSDPSFYCCDYSKAEAAARLGTPGNPD